MLSYQHIYHAGNFADVHKHCLMISLLDALLADSNPLYVLDTHAGRGVYDLHSREAEKTQEHHFGITPLWQARTRQTGLIARYLNILAAYNRGNTLTRYPGSARIARDILRDTDQLVAAELHPGEFEHLARSFAKENPATTDLFHDDGMRGLETAPPPPDARGVAVIDPSYEVKSEYADLPDIFAHAWRGWKDACALIWYPILPASLHHTLLKKLAASGFDSALVSEVHLQETPKEGFRMQGSGIILINTPFGLDQLSSYTQDIAKALSINTKAKARCFTLAEHA